MSRDVSIGAAARASGVKVPTIRYYEQIGLLPAPARSDARRRMFGPDDLQRLAFIRHARELGFDMEAIATLLALQSDPHGSCAAADVIARTRLAEVERRITALETLRGELRRMVDECANGRVAECRVIETLADTNHAHGRFD